MKSLVSGCAVGAFLASATLAGTERYGDWLTSGSAGNTNRASYMTAGQPVFSFSCPSDRASQAIGMSLMVRNVRPAKQIIVNFGDLDLSFMTPDNHHAGRRSVSIE
ncbi:MAG: hypothetical protein WBA25_09800, partial [Jannaschia sp.]